MKSAIEPLITQVKDYVSQNGEQLEALGIAGKIKFHANVQTDKLKKEAKIIFTLVQGGVAKKVKAHRERRARKKSLADAAGANAATPAA